MKKWMATNMCAKIGEFFFGNCFGGRLLNRNHRSFVLFFLDAKR